MFAVVFVLMLSRTVLVLSGTLENEVDINLRNFGIPFEIPKTPKELQTLLGLLMNSNSNTCFDSRYISQTMAQTITKSKTLIRLDCLNDVDYIIHRLNSSKQSLQYVDAAGKPSQGILQGNWLWIGDYQQCYSIDDVPNPITNKAFRGKYFSSAIYQNGKPILGNYPLVYGFCLPDSCGAGDGKELLTMLLNTMAINITFFKNLTVPTVIPDEKLNFDSGAVATIVFSGFLLGLVLMGTLVDVVFSLLWDKNMPLIKPPSEEYTHATERTGLLSGEIFSESLQEGKCYRAKQIVVSVCRAFSFLSNAKKLFGTSTAVGPLACLNGLRVLSMWWVILGHTYGFAAMVLNNLKEAIKINNITSYKVITNATFSVDSFFFLSGLLVAYLAIKEIRDKGRLNWLYFIFHRYWRLTPLYAYVILFFTFLFKYTVSGPFIFFIAPGSPLDAGFEACKSYWWTNLLYINNMYPEYGSLAKTCLGWGWYLANDMQFYIFLSPIVIILLSKVKKVGILVTGFLIVACVAIRGALVSYYGIIGILGKVTKHLDDPWGENGALYGRPYARWSVYLVGMVTGYILAVSNNRLKIYKPAALLGWCVAITTALLVIYDNVGPDASLTRSVFYVSLCRTAWGMCLSWVVLACVADCGGPVKHILSWKFWAPLGRLTYAAYLIHPIVIYAYCLNMLQPLHYSNLTMVYLYFGNLVASYTFAFIISMVVEAPMIQIEKLIRDRFQ